MNDDGDDDSVEAEGATKDLHDQHLHKGSSLGRVGESSASTNNTNAGTAWKVGETSEEPGEEDGESLLLSVVEDSLISILEENVVLIPLPLLWFILEEDWNNNSVDGNSFTEDNPKKKSEQSV